MTQHELPLGLITVHCFACPASVQGSTPDRAHEAMEAHYAEKHARLIGQIVAELG